MVNQIIPQNPLHEFNFHGHPVRMFLIGDSPCFIASDVCEVLNHSNVSKALNGLRDDEKGITKGYTVERGMQDMLYVTQSGLFRLIFRSNKEEAEEFRLWVFNDVLPQIMSTGHYIDASKVSAVDLLRLTWNAIDEINEEARLIRQELGALQFTQGNLQAGYQQMDTRLAKLEKNPRKNYATVRDYMYEYGYLESPERIAGFEGRAIRIASEAGYEVQELEGGQLAFHRDVLKRL